MERKSNLEHLLAIRDGEPVDAAQVAAIGGDVQAQQLLGELTAARAALRQLDVAVPPSPDLWARIEARADRQARSRHGGQAARWGWAGLAAGVLLASGVFLLGVPESSRLAAPDSGISDLVARSRVLEREILQVNQPSGSSSEQALMFRLADIDAELNGVGGDAIPLTAARRAALWQRRVELLETLRALQSTPAPQVQFAVY